MRKCSVSERLYLLGSYYINRGHHGTKFIVLSPSGEIKHVYSLKKQFQQFKFGQKPSCKEKGKSLFYKASSCLQALDAHKPGILFLGHRKKAKPQMRHHRTRCLISAYTVCL